MNKTIKCILITVIIVVLVIVILSEIDRCRPRNLRPSINMYYKHKSWITAPINRIVAGNVRHCNDLLPFPDIDNNFSNHHLLEDNWKKIRNEVMTLYNNDDMTKIKDDLFFRKIADDNWKKFYIKWYSPDCLEDAENKLPFTTDLIQSLPEIKCAMISVLEPGAIITPHVGPFRGSLRYHLGLKTPGDGCYIKVDDIKYSWKDGEGVLFDDTFIHEVKNETDSVRIILFCDIRRDLKSAWANNALNFSCKIAKVTSRGNPVPKK